MRIAISAKTRTRPDRPASIDNCRCSRNQSIAVGLLPTLKLTVRQAPSSTAIRSCLHSSGLPPFARRISCCTYRKAHHCAMLPVSNSSRPTDRLTHPHTQTRSVDGFSDNRMSVSHPSVVSMLQCTELPCSYAADRTCAVQPRTAIPVSSDSAVESLQGLLRLHTAIKDDAHPATVAVSLSGHTATDRPLKGIVSQLATSAPGLEASTVRLTLGLGGPGWGGGASCSEREAFSVA
ncbi:hypothetical protein CABS01_10781 [Colletotrichum abscissum]|uniref:Uncharacterized protein n=1 Tax=Colletotrichum abscissum TaxID=1671311 RepID=A0A9P9XNH8_9PEZI|nr:uncharacterized protein CABS01_10781 [Colletotrichum abscissum]KAI3557365.1 hypothetical protein CABS02_02469 [Colletotrichum abscissum]KAK1497803.1 hypothetical protein CABS01_10781 [Colletotrichum abscissum]